MTMTEKQTRSESASSAPAGRTVMRNSWFAVFVLSLVGAAASAQTALPDLGATLYQGQSGGLYPGGVNQPPAAHAAAALAQAAAVVPRDASGNPSANGIIGMVCLGMSNSSQEFEDFERALDARSGRNAQLVIANTCAGGQAAESMDQASDLYWTTLAPQRLAAAGIDPRQVQVGWMKQAFMQAPTTTFPTHAQALRDTLRLVVQVARTTYPNLRLLYVSSRIYGGFVQVVPGSEPFTFENGFGIKWLIEQQINADPTLNYDPVNGTVLAPLLLWGPYLWANGSTPNNQGTSWLLADYEADHLHPSASGEAKVGALMTTFFDAEASASWLAPVAGSSLSVLDPVADAYVDAAMPGSNFGSDARLRVVGGANRKRIFLRFDVGNVAANLIHAKLVVRDDNTGLSPVVLLASNSNWSEATLTNTNAPAADGGTIAGGSQWSRENCPSFDLTPEILADADGMITVVIDTPSTTEQSLISREGDAALAPKLILSLRTPVDTIMATGFE